MGYYGLRFVPIKRPALINPFHFHLHGPKFIHLIILGSSTLLKSMTSVFYDYILYHHTKILISFLYRRRLNFKSNALKLLHLPLKFDNIHNPNFFICLMFCFRIKMCFSNYKWRDGLWMTNEAKFKWVKCQISNCK